MAIATPSDWRRPTGTGVGRVHDLLDGAEHYIKHLVESTPHPLGGVRLVVDCANGAASDTAPEAYRQAGADVVPINAEPDGLNINDNCGSTHLVPLREAVLEHRADLGIAHDGDADRLSGGRRAGRGRSTVTTSWRFSPLAMREAGTLTRDTLVTTVLSNLGLRLAMQREGIGLVETAVGDRYVLEALRAQGLALGGEQSGHVVLPAHATTGDGILTACT